MNITIKCVARVMSVRCCCRRYSRMSVLDKSKVKEGDDPSIIRNIGILAHIDAGKTTTTERMLFYSGIIKQMGEVHLGNTVTDFMEQERQRGITITSASVTFKWNKHNINLLDTPGHIDFTMEVEQTLNVMDGAVIILDGSAGVEAQTITVWKQADKHNIPRIIYVNKMDKTDAGFFRSVNSVKKQLNVTPVVLHLPVINESKIFRGVVDILTLEKIMWNTNELGVSFCKQALNSEDGKLWEDAVTARRKLTETLADLDDKIAEMIITDEKVLNTISDTKLKESIRKVTIEQKGVPVLCGSSYKNIGVQLLMDAVIDYLPSPLCNQSGKIMKCFGENLCARVFKVRHDGFKGPVTFLRVYSGNITKGQKIYNVKKEKSETCGKLYVAYADDYNDVPEIGPGNVAAVTGLKLTSSGELITSSASAFSAAKKAFYLNTKSKTSDLNDFFSTGISIPDPVFFCSIEAPSQSCQAALDKALVEIEREDPSVRVSVNNETGQVVLGGMGELHLEVIKERIRKEYKLDVYTGPLQIAYKESLIEEAKESFSIKHHIGNTIHSVNLVLSVLKSRGDDKEKLLLDRSPNCVQNISMIFPKHLLAVKQGIESGLASGPKLYCPVVNVNVMLHYLEVGKGTSESIITSATSQAVKKLLKKGGTRLLEPIMSVEVVCNESTMEPIINDLIRRRGELRDTDSRGFDIVIRAFVPLSELLGYSTDLRIMSSGRAAFTMEFYGLRDMNSEEEAKALKAVTGFSH